MIWLCDTSKLSDTLLIANLTILQLFNIFIFYYSVLFNTTWKRFFSHPILTTINVMCYTIYLLLYPIISLFGNLLIKNVSFSDYYIINFIFYTLILLIPISILSIVYFKAIEQPCMKRNWFVTLKKKYFGSIPQNISNSYWIL